MQRLLAIVGVMALCLTTTVWISRISPPSPSNAEDVAGARSPALASALASLHLANETAQQRSEIASAAGGVVTGSVTLRPSRSARHVRVVLQGDNGLEREITPETGEFAFSGLASGKYRLHVAPDSLPADAEVWTNGEEATSPTVVEVTKEKPAAHVDFTVVCAASLTGRVITRDGNGIVRAWVRLTSTTLRREVRARDVFTDDQGNFRFEGMHPDTYRTQVEPPAGLADHDWCGPAPTEFTLDAGDYAGPVILQASAGPCSLVGRVVDQRGEPAANLEVLLYDASPVPAERRPNDWNSIVARLRTDPQGRFSASGLPRRRVGVQVDPNGYSPARPILENRLARWVPPVFVDLQVGAPVRDLATISVLRSSPFALDATVEVQPSMLPIEQANSLDLEVWIVPGDHRLDAFASRQALREQGGQRMSLERSGPLTSAFSWTTDVPMQEHFIYILGGPASLPAAIYPITPQAGGRASVVLPFPR